MRKAVPSSAQCTMPSVSCSETRLKSLVRNGGNRPPPSTWKLSTLADAAASTSAPLSLLVPLIESKEAVALTLAVSEIALATADSSGTADAGTVSRASGSGVAVCCRRVRERSSRAGVADSVGAATALVSAPSYIGGNGCRDGGTVGARPKENTEDVGGGTSAAPSPVASAVATADAT